MKKKLILGALLSVCAFQPKAQVIEGLDEVSLMGEWTVIGDMGSIPVLGCYRPSRITLNDGENCIIEYQEDGVPRNYTSFAGYWIGGTPTGKYTLHLLSNYEYNSHYSGLSLVNFVITYFAGDQMTLQTYDGSCWLELVKNNSAITNVSVDASEESGSVYNINGIRVTNPNTPGIYIQNNGIKIVK